VAISAPVVTSPYNGDTFTTNVPEQTLQGTVPTGATVVNVNGSPATITGLTWSKTVTLTSGTNTFSITATDGVLTSPATTIVITLVTDALILQGTLPPTGIRVASALSTYELSWVDSNSENVRGYRVLYSFEAGGGDTGYKLLYNRLAPTSLRTRDVLIPITSVTTTEDGVRRTVIEEDVRTVNERFVLITELVSPDTIVVGTPVYFVVTAVAYDPTLKREIESLYSLEVEAEAMAIDTNLRDVVRRTFSEVAQDWTTRVLELEPEADVKPGSVADNLFISPVSEEFERSYFLLDFLNRAQSFQDLVQLDDSDGDGVSDPITESAYKQSLGAVLGLTSEAAVQAYVDDAFDKLASRVHVTRKGQAAAQGTAILFTTLTPTEDIIIPVGATVASQPVEAGQAVQTYAALSPVTIPLSDINSYYNPTSKAYEILLQVQCTQLGSAGNLDPSRLRNVVSGIPTYFRVRNDGPMTGGRDQESNADLAQRAELAWVSVDSGTEGGYLSRAVGLPNVERVSIVRAGHPLMMRDYDPVRNKHIGGKVDIYLQSDITQSITETFSFVNPYRTNELVVVENVALFQLRVTNGDVSASRPITQVSRVHNATQGMDYNLTNLQVIGGSIIMLDMTQGTNTSIGFHPADIYRVSYTYLADTLYVPEHQPVLSVTSLTGDQSGDLGNHYNFYRTEDILDTGNSADSSDAIELISHSGLPLFQLNPYTETLVLAGQNEESLSRVGVDIASIVVRPEPTVLIPSPTPYVLDVDYEITSEGDSRTPATISRISTGGITNGDTVEVLYNAGENFTVVFQTTKGAQELEAEVAKTQHVTADVLVKSMVITYIDIEGTAVLKDRANVSQVNAKMLANIAAEMSNNRVNLHHSDIIAAIERTPGVDYCVVPLSLLARRKESLVVRGALVNPVWTTYASGAVVAYKTQAGVLPTPTTDKGGAEAEIAGGPGVYQRFTGVYQNSLLLTAVETPADLVTAPGQFYIFADGSIGVSTTTGLHPDTYSFDATYYAAQGVTAADINATAIEVFRPGGIFMTLKKA
jgi:hypothetical protein